MIGQCSLYWLFIGQCCLYWFVIGECGLYWFVIGQGSQYWSLIDCADFSLYWFVIGLPSVLESRNSQTSISKLENSPFRKSSSYPKWHFQLIGYSFIAMFQVCPERILCYTSGQLCNRDRGPCQGLNTLTVIALNLFLRVANPIQIEILFQYYPDQCTTTIEF